MYLTSTTPPVHAYKSNVQPVIFQCFVFVSFIVQLLLYQPVQLAIATTQSTGQLSIKVWLHSFGPSSRIREHG